MPVRSEIDDEFKWAVNDLYSTDEAWEKDYRKVCGDAGQPGTYKGHIGDSSDNLYNALKEYFIQTGKIEKQEVSVVLSE